MTRAAAVISDEQKQALVHDLIECKAKLFDQSKAMKQLKEAHEVQLVAVSRQLLGQAHHMFSRFLNLRIYESKKFYLFCFSTSFLLRSKIPIYSLFIINRKRHFAAL
jgi:hypothetical protein